MNPLDQLQQPDPMDLGGHPQLALEVCVIQLEQDLSRHVLSCEGLLVLGQVQGAQEGLNLREGGGGGGGGVWEEGVCGRALSRLHTYVCKSLVVRE